MPIYEYRCNDCGFQKEYLQKISDAPLTDCPECGEPKLTKMVTAAGFQLKGTGWYATDFKNSSQPKRKSVDKASAEQSTPATDSKSASDATGGKSDKAATAASPAASGNGA